MYTWSVARGIVKVRRAGGAVVVSIPQDVLQQLDLAEGDRVLVEALPPHRLLLTKETEQMPNTQRTELELAVLESRQAALARDLESKMFQHNNSMELDPGLTDDGAFELAMLEGNKTRAQFDVEIAEKRLQLFNLKGSVPQS